MYNGDKLTHFSLLFNKIPVGATLGSIAPQLLAVGAIAIGAYGCSLNRIHKYILRYVDEIRYSTTQYEYTASRIPVVDNFHFVMSSSTKLASEILIALTPYEACTLDPPTGRAVHSIMSTIFYLKLMT